MPDQPQQLPLGLNTGHLLTFGGAVAGIIGTFYVSQYRITALEEETKEFQTEMRQQVKVTTVQEDVLRRLGDIEHRLDRLERQMERVQQRQVPDVH